MIGDFLFCLVYFKENDWRFGLVVFFSCGLVVVVVAVDSRGGCGWCCGCFWGNGIYYFIVVILFYCDIYIILLC